jgi:cystinosin
MSAAWLFYCVFHKVIENVLVQYWNKGIIDEYKSRMSATSGGEDETTNNAQITVQGNDAAFAIHALIMSSFTLSQIGMYDSFAARPPSRRVYAILSFVIMFCIIYIGATWKFEGHVDFLGFLYVLGSIKIAVTIGKYVPQALLNQTRKSTVGWNVWNVILDLTGNHTYLWRTCLRSIDSHLRVLL